MVAIMAENNPRALIERTDRGVKTTEAWWSFGEKLSDPRLWIAIGSVTGTAGTVIGNFFGWMSGHGWPGWGMAAMAGLAVAIVLAIL
jgi:hypothetical protein